jgi:hypothetical protein
MKRSTTGNAGSSTDSNEGSSYSTPDNKAQLVLGFRQGNDFSDISDGAGSGAVSGPKDNRKQRRLRYEQKIDVMAVVKLKQACWDRPLPVGGTKAELQKRLRTAGDANGRNAGGKVKRKGPKRKCAAGKRTQSNALKTDIVIVDGTSLFGGLRAKQASLLEQEETTATPVVRTGQKRPQTAQVRKRESERNPNMAELRPRLRH